MGKRVFLSTDGRLRVGFRLVVYLAAFLACAAGLGVLGHSLRMLMPRWARQILFAAVYSTAIIAAVRGLRRYVDRRSWESLGLPALRVGYGRLAQGFGVGVMMLSAVFVVEWRLGWITVTGTSFLARALAPRPVVANLVSLLAVGLSEELLFRGAVFRNLGEAAPLWVATAIAGVLFGLFHLLNPAVQLDAGFLLSCALGTCMLVLARLVTGNLYWAIGWHASWDWMQDVLGLAEPGAPRDTALLTLVQHGPRFWVGDSSSLEGGGLAITTAALGILGMLLWATRRRIAISWQSKLAESA